MGVLDPTQLEIANLAPATVSLVILVLLVAVAFRIWRALVTPLRDLPGPVFASFTRLWYLKNVWRGDFEKVNVKLHERYGPIVRIAPNEYSIDDPEAIKVIYGHGTSFTKAPWYYASGSADPNEHNLFTDRNPKRHSETRRKVAALYSMSTLVQLEHFVTEGAECMVDKFEGFAQSGVTVNMQEWAQFWAFDVIGLITLAKRFGFLDTGRDQGGLLGALHGYLLHCANVGIYHEWHPLVTKLEQMLPGQGMSYLTGFTQKEITERLNATKRDIESSKEGADFLSKLLKMHSDDPAKITMAEVFLGCLTNIGAGSDTTSISFAAIMYHLIKNPEVYKKLRTEIDSKVKEKPCPNDIITFAETQTMPYLQASIKEGLRMHPATGLPLARVVPVGGATISGRYFPEGTIVGVNSWVAHRNKSVFGADAAQYRPERWLESPERSSQMERYFMAFGVGSRTCIGKNISLLEISKLVPEFVRRFDFELQSPDQPLNTHNAWFVKQTNFFVKVAKRKIDKLDG
ncbi:uncharacterized protein A1O9_06966 [Exophiala aquamarina CBS 119918]|uniref:Cytochrome P450 oxidoreductase n=1 Tax=Exophiala aquamarina CBS 119918 TaxID=1182545 RepID=A0A072PAC4_9EURO|nr:uncharacterized protein A1O9_06966 [Exophiala aquamarina CBS 119918]KEF56776.1 hypothetical protein A1O9_06966 [Exophiala aquamarina CBS 119918]